MQVAQETARSEGYPGGSHGALSLGWTLEKETPAAVPCDPNRSSAGSLSDVPGWTHQSCKRQESTVVSQERKVLNLSSWVQKAQLCHVLAMYNTREVI